MSKHHFTAWRKDLGGIGARFERIARGIRDAGQRVNRLCAVNP
jgi:hypothetical protein